MTMSLPLSAPLASRLPWPCPKDFRALFQLFFRKKKKMTLSPWLTLVAGSHKLFPSFLGQELR